MNTTNMTLEQISAFADNEFSDGHLDVTLAALRQQQGRDIWNRYHQIGDALRSDDLNTQLSPDFTEKMFARLDAEPTILIAAHGGSPVAKGVSLKRFAMPGMAAAAVAVIAFLAVPQVVTQKEAVVASQAIPIVTAALAPQTITVVSQEGEVLRDPRIDEYLLAHQRFSPSVYSTAQYARSATFAVDADK